MPKRILYVEDLEEWRSLVSSLLSPEGFEVVAHDIFMITISFSAAETSIGSARN